MGRFCSLMVLLVVCPPCFCSAQLGGENLDAVEYRYLDDEADANELERQSGASAMEECDWADDQAHPEDCEAQLRADAAASPQPRMALAGQAR